MIAIATTMIVKTKITTTMKMIMVIIVIIIIMMMMIMTRVWHAALWATVMYNINDKLIRTIECL